MTGDHSEGSVGAGAGWHVGGRGHPICKDVEVGLTAVGRSGLGEGQVDLAG